MFASVRVKGDAAFDLNLYFRVPFEEATMMVGFGNMIEMILSSGLVAFIYCHLVATAYPSLCKHAHR